MVSLNKTCEPHNRKGETVYANTQRGAGKDSSYQITGRHPQRQSMDTQNTAGTILLEL
jgi:hypothetical protein